MYLPDHDEFGMYMRLDLWLPTNVYQRVALWRTRRELGFRPDDAQVLKVVKSLHVLNQYARDQHGDYRRFIYGLKADCLHALYAYGYLAHVEVEQQVLKCHTCTRGIWERGTDHEAWCWNCHGTGVYKRIRLLKFTVRADNKEFVFHQPDELCHWAWDLVDPPFLASRFEDLPKYSQFAYARVHLSNWQLQSHIVRVAHFTASLFMFGDVKLQDWKRAFSHDCREVLQHAAHWMEWRVRYGYRTIARLWENDKLPF